MVSLPLRILDFSQEVRDCDDVAWAAASHQHHVALHPLRYTALEIILLLLGCLQSWQQFLQKVLT